MDSLAGFDAWARFLASLCELDAGVDAALNSCLPCMGWMPGSNPAFFGWARCWARSWIFGWAFWIGSLAGLDNALDAGLNPRFLDGLFGLVLWLGWMLG